MIVLVFYIELDDKILSKKIKIFNCLTNFIVFLV